MLRKLDIIIKITLAKVFWNHEKKINFVKRVAELGLPWIEVENTFRGSLIRAFDMVGFYKWHRNLIVEGYGHID